MTGPRRALDLYARTVRTCFSRAGLLAPLAVAVFVPVGLVHSVPVHADLTSLDAAGGARLAAAALAVAVLSAVGLLGEVFYAGVVAVALTQRREGRPPPLREIARKIEYGRLIAVDLLYGLAVVLGLLAFVVPGVALYVYLGIAAPLVEIEHETVREAFARSFRLVRGRFWLVASVLIPFEIAGDALTDLATGAAHSLLGGSLLAEWLADASANVLFTPFYAVAAVLLTVDLCTEERRRAPTEPEPVTA